MTQQLARDSTSGSCGIAATVPDAVVAVHSTESDLTTAIKHLEHERYSAANISVLDTGMSQERHVVGFEAQRTHAPWWAAWHGLWGWIFGAFVMPRPEPDYSSWTVVGWPESCSARSASTASSMPSTPSSSRPGASPGAWSQTDGELTRRYDLILNLVDIRR